MARTPRTTRYTYEWTYFEQIDNNFFSSLDARKKIIETSTASVPDDPFKTLLELLGLSEFFSGKLSLQTTQTKVDELFSSTSVSTKSVPWIILRKLIASDSDFREKALEEFLEKKLSCSRKNSISSNHSNDSSKSDSSHQSSLKTDEESEEENGKSLRCHDEENKTSCKQGSINSKVKSTDEKKSEIFIKYRVYGVFHQKAHDSSFFNTPEKEESLRKTISSSRSKHKTHKTFVSEMLIIQVRGRNNEYQQTKNKVTNTSVFSESCLYERHNRDSRNDSSHKISPEKEESLRKTMITSRSKHETHKTFVSELLIIPVRSRHEENQQTKNKVTNTSDFSESCLYERHHQDSRKDSLNDISAITLLSTFHPMDVLLAIYQCCDFCLRRLLAHKFHSCQFAIPFVYNTFEKKALELSIWPLRDIYLGHHHEPAIKMEMPSISFLRFGQHFMCKSKLINLLLKQNNDLHKVFQDDTCAEEERKISSGMIELFWSIRNSKEKRSFSVLNLRGDALNQDECKKQLELLMTVSNAFVLFVDAEAMEKEETRRFCKRIKDVNKKCLIVTQDSVNANSKVFSVNAEKKKIRSSDKVDEKLIEKIFSLRKSVKNCRSLEKEIFADFQRADIDIDENKDDCCNGKAKAKEVLKLCNLDSKTFSKHDLIPLQGKDLWCKWSKLDKERQKKGKNCIDLEERLLKCMIEIRKQQIIKCNSSNSALATFVKVMLELQQDDATLLYFIFWIKQGLDEASKSQLPKLRRELEEAVAHQNKSTGESEKVIKLKESIADASFGIEHIFREISQIYEAFASMEGSLNRKTERIIEKLPCVVAKLSLLGQPLEIMDGDAADVPLLWLKKIFAEINMFTHAELVTSVSVIGVQSSGKSTLLNTMFGIQFPVSAGRCTRGVYAQLIPVSKDVNKFGYLMIIDTEGLRAPETAEEKIDFDNEIAALAIGLSEVSIINIPGETIGEMREILQIAVHAFIRLKKSNQSLDYKQSGIFVHQNVSASDAKEKTFEGTHAFMKHLDSMAKIAAKDEQMPNISSFGEVIDLDENKDKIFIPNFLQNDASTMPYVSQGYCKAVTAAKRRIFDKLKKHVDHLCNASDTFWNLCNLWKGIQAETFIFSFRNCQEAIASKMLAKKFQDLTWSFEEKKHDWWNKNKQKLIVDKDLKVENCASELNKNFSKMMSCEAEAAKHALTDFIEDHSYKTFMKHFEERRLHDLQHYIDNLKRTTFEDINREKRQRIEFLKNYDEMITKQSKIKEEARDLAKNMQNWESDYGQLSEIFQKWWNDTLDEKCSQYDGFEVIRGKLRSEMEDFLAGVYSISMKFDENLKCTDKVPRLKDSLKAEGIPLDGIRIAKGNKQSANFPQLVVNVLNLSFEKIEHYFEGLLQKDSRFDELHFKTILRFVVDDIEEHNKKYYKWYSIKESLVNDVIQHVSKKTFPVFLNLNKDYETKYGMRSELSKCRVKAFQIFKDTFYKYVEGRQEEKRKRDEICKLEKMTEQYRKELKDIEIVMTKTEEKLAQKEEICKQRQVEFIEQEEKHQKKLEEIRQVQQERKQNMRLEEESLKQKEESLFKKLEELSKKRDEQILAMEYEKKKYEEKVKQLEEEFAKKEMNMKEIREKSRKEEERKQRQKEEMKKMDSLNIESSTDFIINELHTVLGEKFVEFLRHRMKRFIVKKFEGQKENLMISVLKELAKQESSDNYKSYISSPETYVLKWLTEYSKAIFFGNYENSRSEFMKCLEEFATPTFSSLKGCAALVNNEWKEKSIRKWVKEYQRKLEEEEIMISSKSFDDVEYEIQDFDLFLSVLKNKLIALEEEMNRKQPEKIKWKEKTPYEETMNFLWGCAENCPWCNEPCKSSIPNHADDENFHECLQHRPVGIHGIYKEKSKLLVIESCEFKVQSSHTLNCGTWCGCNTKECASSHLYSDYKKIIPQWKIVPCADMSNAKYWTWVIGKFYKDFEEQFGKTFSSIPDSWIEISKTEAIESLDTYKTDESVKSLEDG